jgi:hypothetical protein
MPSIKFETINNHYEWGYYFEFKVLIMTKNGYLNATRMCKDKGKKLGNWLQNLSSKELIDEFESEAGNPSDGKSMITISGGNDLDYRGTYIHPDLIPSIASWISPAFALKVNRIVNEYRLREEKLKHVSIVKEKDDKIDELKNMILRMESKNDNVFKDIKATVTDLTDNISKLSLENQITHEKLDDVQETLSIVVEDRVVRPDDESTMNTIVIYENEKDNNKFYIFRVQKRGFKVALKRYLNKNPDALKFDEIDYNPNAINYYNRFKKEYKKEIKSCYNSFELIGITKNTLREFIAKVNNEKYQIENCKQEAI